ncbi:putative phage abortive infection protein [Autumnicola musiva]|uniref:Phage abortive infection protein n=1 Tax=Autumnicola musiva TaxID=3075589 RepID=A0ABU3D9T1_9FLAO|nr:putative phage abortive infection protein [Zunongwangia sp. F117]MDT0678297.1 putative phage abortive infection protein [Zunongwangia sp. F117]
MNDSTLRNWLWFFGILSLSLLTFAVFAPFIIPKSNPDWLPSIDYQTGNEIGITFNGLMSPFIAISAALLTFIAFLVQYQANKKIQEQFKIQEVDQLFFEMLKLHKENVNEFNIDGYDHIVTKQPDSKDSLQKIQRQTSQRKVFVTMVTELEAIIEIAQLMLQPKTDKNKERLFQVAYEIFFFGIESENVQNWNFHRFEQFKLKLKNIRKKHSYSYSKENKFVVNGKYIHLYIKYKPFSGHENRLGHYYRHLYSTVDYIVSREKDRTISKDKSQHYLKLLRAQLSNDEQLLLYYNYRIGYGANWDKRGERNNAFLTQFKMIHNIPIKKVKFIEKPEVHFKDYIRKKNPNLFEQYTPKEIEVT